MPKLTSQQQLDRLVAVVSGYAEGAGIEIILDQLLEPLPRRTLQRRLAVLVQQGRLQKQGDARAVRYLRVFQTSKLVLREPDDIEDQGDESYVPISAEGREIKVYVRQPRPLRRPVGYKLKFLEQYYPNQTAYLPMSLRKQLHSMGRSPAHQAKAGTFARDIFSRLLIDLSWASSQLEGNTYSRLDTERLIEFGQIAEGKGALETQMILNHKDAIEYLVRDNEQATLTPATVTALHAMLSNGLMADPTACGRVRSRGVEIGGSVYLPLALPQRLEALFEIVVNMAADIDDPFEQAFFLMVHLPYLQPFEDVNKRVSRLTANIPFIRHNLCPLSFLDVPQQAYVDAMIGVYELNRIELLRDVFIWAYERSCQQYVAVKQNLVQPDIFRIRYRRALSEVMASVIRSDQPANEAVIQSKTPADVLAEDKARFLLMAQAEFQALHPGNSIRFGIRPLECAAWQLKFMNPS